MKQFFSGIQCISDIVKKVRSFELIASVPQELKEEFDQLRLKNTVHRLKIFCIVLLVTNFLRIHSIFSRNTESFEISNIFSAGDYLDFIIIALFFILIRYFYKKSKRFISWSICYLFGIYNVIISLLIIPPLGSQIEVISIRNPTTSAVNGAIIPDPLSVTLAEVPSLGDDVLLKVTGTVEKALGDERYLFSDHSGKMIVEIDDEVWRRSSIDPKSLKLPAQFEIIGEHDEEPRWSEIDSVQLFFWYITLVLLLPDLLPSIFIPFSFLYCLISLLMLSSEFELLFVYSHSKVFIINIFFVVLVTKILFYNSKVRTLVNTFNITKLNKDLMATNKKLEALAITDELTKLNNRRSFLDYMDIIWKQCHSLKFPIAVIMIDVDYFKKYNDSLGHLAGDNTLVAVAQCLKNQLKRETDFIARFGGEEFVCLLPYIDKTEALNIANSLVESVESMKIPHPMSDHAKHVTISAGMAIVVPDDNNSQTQLLDEADKALYSAKQSGRNRVVVN